ncbi:unnamed protein product [Symbiodinium sp. KB8]|nr:unnamed protein product [Symbiodinium sp. KB8]
MRGGLRLLGRAEALSRLDSLKDRSPLFSMGQSPSLTAPCYAARDGLNPDFPEADVEAPSPSLADTETSPESDGCFASASTQTDEFGAGVRGGSPETRSCHDIVTPQGIDTSPMPVRPVLVEGPQKFLAPRFPESPAHPSVAQSSLCSDQGPLPLRVMFNSSQDRCRQHRRQALSEPPMRIRGASKNLTDCRHGPDGAAKADRLVHIIRRERRTHKRVLDFLAEHGFKGVDDSRRQRLGYARWCPLHAAVTEYDAEMAEWAWSDSERTCPAIMITMILIVRPKQVTGVDLTCLQCWKHTSCGEADSARECVQWPTLCVEDRRRQEGAALAGCSSAERYATLVISVIVPMHGVGPGRRYGSHPVGLHDLLTSLQRSPCLVALRRKERVEFMKKRDFDRHFACCHEVACLPQREQAPVGSTIDKGFQQSHVPGL